MTSDKQVRKLMAEMARVGQLGVAALRAGMDRKTARKYVKSGRLPSESVAERGWRTRPDPFVADWPEIEARLVQAPELEGRALFEDLLSRKPGAYAPGQLRTFQRHVREWRALHGPAKAVFFAQEHRPGEALQTDFTWAKELEITLGGEPYSHLLCHSVLPYSNWEWATPCQSESMAAIKKGVQSAVFRLGGVPRYHQTDNSTAATHELGSGKRGFNEEYLALMRHLGMEPRTIEVGESEQNGDIEASNGALKRRLKQHLLLRGSREFEDRGAYEAWLQGVLERANALRVDRVQQELPRLRQLRVERMPEHTQEDVRVSGWSTIRVKRNAYSVPSRLIGEVVQVRRYEDHLEVYYGGARQLTVERLSGRNGRRINYRHIIWSLVQKPGAFPRYTYREELFPTLSFRKVYDALSGALESRRADIEYLRILHLAASTMESEVEAALELLAEAGEVPLADKVKGLVAERTPSIPGLAPPVVDLRSYDALLEQAAEVA